MEKNYSLMLSLFVFRSLDQSQNFQVDRWLSLGSTFFVKKLFALEKRCHKSIRYKIHQYEMKNIGLATEYKTCESFFFEYFKRNGVHAWCTLHMCVCFSYSCSISFYFSFFICVYKTIKIISLMFLNKIN